MIIQKVSMRNFVSYQDASVDFPLGVTVIVGQNGAGKTSILDAVTYSLFREHGRGVDANLIRRGQPQSKVAVVFSVRGKNYEVEWSLSPGKPSIGNLRDISSGYPLVKPGSGEKTIIPEIAKLIGVDSKVFMNAIYVRQGQLAQLIEERPAERKKIIGHLLGIDELEKLWEALKDPLSTLRNELTNYEFKLRKADEIKTQLQQKKQELETKKHELSEIESKRREISEQLTGKRRELEMLREKKRIDEELTRNIITISADLQSRKSELKLVSEKITELTKAIQDIDTCQADYREYRSIESEVKKLYDELKSVEEQIEKKKPLSDELERKKVEAEYVDKQVKAFLSDFQRRTNVSVSEDIITDRWSALVSRLQTDITRQQQTVEKLSHQTTRYTALSAALLTSIPIASIILAFFLQSPVPLLINILPVYTQILINRRRKKVEQEIQATKARLELLMNTLNELEKIRPDDVKNYQRRRDELAAQIAKLSSQVGELQVLEQRRTAIQDKIRENNRVLETLKPNHDTFIRAVALVEKHGLRDITLAKTYVRNLSQQAESLSTEIQKMTEEKQLLENRKKELFFDQGLLDKAEALYEKLRDEEKRLEGLYGALLAAVNAIEESVKNLEKEMETLEKLRQEYDKLSTYVNSLERIREVFHKDGLLQKIIRKQASVTVEQVARVFLQHFELRFDDIRIDEDFNVTVYGPNGEQSIETLSGGEKIVVAILLRLAIASSLAGEKLESIIMDEPTIHLDTERRRELVNVLKNFAGGKRIIPQVIVVSHDRELIEAADTVYEVTATAKGSTIIVHTK